MDGGVDVIRLVNSCCEKFVLRESAYQFPSAVLRTEYRVLHQPLEDNLG